MKDETLRVRIKARPAATARRKTSSEPQCIIFEDVKLVAKWVKKFPSPIQHGRGGRMKQLLTKDCFFLKLSALPMRKVGGRECGLAAVFSAIQSQVQRKHVCLFRMCRF